MSTTKTTKKGPKFTAEERAAMKARAAEMKAEASESDVLAAIAKMPPSDRALAKKFHEIARAVAPEPATAPREIGAASVLAEELQQFGPEFGADFYSNITLDATVNCHDVAGGTAVARVHEALARQEARLSAAMGQMDGNT